MNNWRKNRKQAVQDAIKKTKQELKHYEHLLYLLSTKKEVKEYWMKDCPRRCCKI